MWQSNIVFSRLQMMIQEHWIGSRDQVLFSCILLGHFIKSNHKSAHQIYILDDIANGNRPSPFTLVQLYYLTFWFSFPSPSSAAHFPSSPFYLFSHLPLSFPSAFSTSHLILRINSSGVSLPWGWQALWLKGLLACSKWEANCHCEARRGSL